MFKKFWRFVFPSMLAFAFSGLYAIVDGFFVGRSTGDIGLAAINIAYPLTALIQAVGTGIGMGGAIPLAVARGGDDTRKERTLLGNALILLLIACLLVLGGLLLCYRPLLGLLGARGEVLEAAADYIRIIILGSVFQILATGFTPMLRNYEASLLAMLAMVGGFVTNIVLDAWFVAGLQLGVSGAALATIIGQAVTALPCILFLLRKMRFLDRRDFLPQGALVRQILTTGLSPFGLAMSPNIVLLLINRSAVAYGGDAAVAAYAVVAYVHCIVLLLLQGVGDGCQPLISFHLGKGEIREARTARNIAYVVALTLSAVYMAVAFSVRDIVSPLFGASDDAAQIVRHALPIFAVGAPAIAVCRITTSYFYSIRRNTFSYLLVYGELVVLFLLLQFVLPPLLELDGVWLSPPAAQAALALVSVVLIAVAARQTRRTAG